MGLFNRVSREPANNKADAAGERRLGEVPPVDAQGRRLLEDHVAYLLSMIEPLAPFGMSLMDAWGHTLCEDLKSYGDIPPTAVAEVSGYGFRFADLGLNTLSTHPILTLVGAPRRAVGPGETSPETFGAQAVRVLAGEELPEGVDTVVAGWQVSVDEAGRYITIVDRVAQGDWVRPPGTEARDGQLVLAAGTELDDRRSALLAAAGFDRVMARPHTRVAAVHVMGDASFDGGRATGVGLHLVNGAAQSDGATVWRVELDLTAPDAARERLSDELIRADCVLTIGGLTDEGADPRLTGLLGGMGDVSVAEVAMRPGRYHGFGLIGDENVPVVMLPSDPTALLVAYHAFARPVLRKLMGAEPFSHEPMLCFADRDFRVEVGVTQLLPCRLHQVGNRYMASEIIPRNHSWLTTLVAADALVLLPQNRQRVYAGEAMACWLLGYQRVAAE